MLRRILAFSLATLSLSFIAKTLFLYGQGQVAWHYDTWVIQMPLWSLILSLMLLAILLRLIWLIIRPLFFFTSLFRRHQKRRHQKLTEKAWLAFLSGQWKEAKRTFNRAHYHQDQALSPTLKDHGEALLDGLLGVQKKHPTSSMIETFLAILHAKPQEMIHHAKDPSSNMLSFYAYAYAHHLLDQPDELYTCILKYKRQFSKTWSQYPHLFKPFWHFLFTKQDRSYTAKALWQTMPKSWRDDPDLLTDLFSGLSQEHGQPWSRTLERHIQHQTHTLEMMQAWSNIETPDAKKRLNDLIKWQKKWPDDRFIGLAMAMHYSQTGCWKNACHFYEQHAVADLPLTLKLDYGKCLVELGDHTQAYAYYQSL